MIEERVKTVHLERFDSKGIGAVTDAHIANIENGECNISRKSAEKLVESLEVGVEWR